MSRSSTAAELEPTQSGAPGAFALAWAGARRRWALAGLVGLLLGGTAATAYYALTPQKFTVSASLQICSHDPILREQEYNPARELDYRRNQAALVRSRPVIEKALADTKVRDSGLLADHPDKAGWLEGAVQTALLDGGLLRVSLTGQNPAELADAVNAITAAYFTQVVDAEAKQRQASAVELEELLEKAETRIRDLKTVERGLAGTLRTRETPAGKLHQEAVMAVHAAILRELGAVQSQLRPLYKQIEAQKGLLEKLPTEPIPDDVQREALEADPAVKTVADDIARLDAHLASGTVLTGSNAHARLLADLKEAKERLKKRQEERKEPVLKELRERLVKEAAGRLTKLKERLSELERQQTDLTQEAQRTRQEVENLAPQSAELEQKRAEIEQAEELTRRLRSKKEWLSFELLTYKKRVILVARAEASAARPAASAVAASAALGAAGFALGALGVGFIESRRRRLVHSTDAAQAMKLRVFGHLPLVPGLARGPLLGVWGTQFGLSGSLLVEAVNDFRAMLLSGGSGRPPQVIMATSAGEGEGKTTLACLLALSLAQIGKRTLLIDGDLRNPQVSNRLGLPASAGLGEVLRGEARPGGVIGGVPGTPLAVMSAGRPCATIIRGLSVERVQQVLAELRKQFDHIVIDSSPAPLTDGLVIGACVDAAVLVVRAGHSAEPLVRTACERLLAGRVPLVGGVMNGLPSAGHGLRYPYASLPPAEPADAPSVATSA